MHRICIPERFGSLYVCAVPERGRQAEHETAYALLKQAVYAYAQNQSFPEESLVLEYNAYQKPRFRNYPDIHFNLSHCEGLAVCLLSAHECGVDAEAKREIRPAVVRRVFSEEEQQILKEAHDPDWMFTRFWTLKEAYVKAIGRGIGFSMQNVNFRIAEGEIFCNQKHAEFCQVQYDRYIISSCIIS